MASKKFPGACGAGGAGGACGGGGAGGAGGTYYLVCVRGPTVDGTSFCSLRKQHVCQFSVFAAIQLIHAVGSYHVT